MLCDSSLSCTCRSADNHGVAVIYMVYGLLLEPVVNHK